MEGARTIHDARWNGGELVLVRGAERMNRLVVVDRRSMIMTGIGGHSFACYGGGKREAYSASSQWS